MKPAEVQLRQRVVELKTGPFGSALSADEYTEEGVPLINPSDLRDSRVQTDTAAKVPETVAQRLAGYRLRDGDLVVARRGELGRYGLVTADAAGAMCGTGSLLVRPGVDLDAKFLGYVLETLATRDWLSLQSVGSTMDNLSERILARLPIPDVSHAIQQRIANFLDKQTVRIDALIAEKGALLGKLKEQQYSYASQLLVRGLNPSVPLTPTSFPEIGAVPAHWDVKRLKFLGEVRSGIAKGKDHGDAECVLLPYLRVANVQDGYVDLTEVLEIEVATPDVSRYLLQKGDVLMNEGGDNDKLGRGTVWQCQIDPCVHQNHVFAVRLVDTSLAEWVAKFTSTDAARTYFYLRSKQSTNLASINQSNVRELPVPMPPAEERLAILAELNRFTSAAEQLRDHARAHLERLREYRASLISAAVTGQLDIGEFQAKLPEAA